MPVRPRMGRTRRKTGIHRQSWRTHIFLSLIRRHRPGPRACLWEQAEYGNSWRTILPCLHLPSSLPDRHGMQARQNSKTLRYTSQPDPMKEVTVRWNGLQQRSTRQGARSHLNFCQGRGIVKRATVPYLQRDWSGCSHRIKASGKFEFIWLPWHSSSDAPPYFRGWERKNESSVHEKGCFCGLGPGYLLYLHDLNENLN